MSRRTLRIGVGVAAVILLFVVWFALQAYPLGHPGKLVVVTVNTGDSMSTVTGELHAKGVIASTFAFDIDTSLFGPRTVRAGSYQIAQNSSFSHVRSVLSGGPNVDVVSVIPGLTLHEVADTLATDRGAAFAESFLAATAQLAGSSPYHPDLRPPALSGKNENVNAFEGLIGVGQYLVTPTETPGELADKMAAGFDAEAASVGFSPTTSVNGLNAYQLLTAASIVVREGYYPSNMPQVARVIFNRLQRGGSLQMDSTIKYPLGLDAGGVTTAMLQIASPYNSYLSAGLTPTPICSVSTAALGAVLHAPPGNWLYFVVVTKSGREAFAATYAGQLANERLAQKNGVG